VDIDEKIHSFFFGESPFSPHETKFFVGNNKIL